ncbi:MAG: Ig-like domain-containing protein [Gemmatimonadota bacterium]|nr:Ig-like domain-containing protein [Gammaproteobacteria bacterium]MDE2984713.1 Ig-like domain-containing protein [Gemmatimonadota bacterium]
MSCSRTMRVWTVAAGVAAASACGGDSGGPTAPPTIDPPRATTVTVSPAAAELPAVGATVQLSAEVRDQNGQAMAGATVTWSSSDASVATVDASGLVTAAGNGTATVTATAGSVSGTATVTVAQEVGAVKVTPAIDTLVAFGDTVRLSAEAVDANAHRVEEVEFSWTSSDTSVAVVGDAGLVTGVGPGQAEVTATVAGVTGRADLTVVAPAPTTIVVTPDTVALAALGQTAQLSAEVRDQIGRAMEGIRVSWSSADTTVVAVDSAGLVTAVGVGETTITATAGEASGEALVTVMQSAGSVVVSPAADTVAIGDTLRLAAEAFDENGHRVEGAQFEWSSSVVSVAQVDGSGLVTAVAEGTATITVTAGAVRGTAEITVENPDRAALEALYETTDGPNWLDNTNWLTDVPLGEWYGVDTDALGRVVRLDLSGTWDTQARRTIVHGLSGPIPPEMSGLANLEWLNLSGNQLTGPIPSELGDLANLRSLLLWSNNLSGPIPPELGRLSHLRSLDVYYNDLSGPIPPELGKLASMTRLQLGSNGLSGPIPPELGTHLPV